MIRILLSRQVTHRAAQRRAPGQGIDLGRCGSAAPGGVTFSHWFPGSPWKTHGKPMENPWKMDEHDPVVVDSAMKLVPNHDFLHSYVKINQKATPFESLIYPP